MKIHFFTPDRIIVISKAPLIREYIKEYCSKCGINTDNFSKFFYFISHSTHNSKLTDRLKSGIQPKRSDQKDSPGYGEISFENSLIIIDEIHQFINFVSNGINKSKGVRTQLNLYNKINNTKNCKIIGLTGTPIYKNYDSLILLIHLFKRTEKYSRQLSLSQDKKYIPSEHNYDIGKVIWGNEDKRLVRMKNLNPSINNKAETYIVRDEKGETIKIQTLSKYKLKDKTFINKIRGIVNKYKSILKENNKTIEEITYNKFLNYDIKEYDNYLQNVFGDWISIYNPFKEGNKSSFPEVISNYKNIIAIKMSKEHQDYFIQEYEKEDRINRYNSLKENKGGINIEQEFKNDNSIAIRARLREFSLTSSNFYYPYIDDKWTRLSAKFCDKHKNMNTDTKILPIHYNNLENDVYINYSKIFYTGWLKFYKKFKNESGEFIPKVKKKWEDQKNEWFNKNKNLITLLKLELEIKKDDAKQEDTEFNKIKKKYLSEYDQILLKDNLDKFKKYLDLLSETKDSQEQEIIQKNNGLHKKFITTWLGNKQLSSLIIFKLSESEELTNFKIKKSVNGWIDESFFKENNKNKLKLINQKLFYMIMNIIMHPFQKHVVFTKFITKSGIDLIESMFKFIIKCLKKEIDEKDNIEGTIFEKYKKYIDFWSDKILLRYTGDDKHINIDSKKYSSSTIFNAKNNNYGQKFPLMLVSEAGFTGLNLLCVRHQHFFNQLANPVTKEQALGRGIRFESHFRLKESERNISIWEYFNCTDTEYFKLFLENPEKFIQEQQKAIDIIKASKDPFKKIDFGLGGIDYELYIKHKMVIEDYIYLYSLLDKYDINTTVDILNNDYVQFKQDILKILFLKINFNCLIYYFLK